MLSAGVLAAWAGAGRALDLAVALPLFLLLAPVLALAWATARASGGGLRREPHAGRHGRLFGLYRLSFGRKSRLGWIGRLPVLLNVVRGDMSLIGPRPMPAGEAPHRDSDFWRRSTVRPGLISLFWVRQRTNIAFEGELATDARYAETRSLRGDLGIGLRAGPAALYGGAAPACPEQVSILGVVVANLSLPESVAEIVLRARRGAGCRICFVNADCLNLAYRDAAYCDALQSADLVLPDGIGLKLAGRLLGRPIRQNVNGTDLFPRLCAELAQAGKSIYLLGGRPGVPETVAAWIRSGHPALNIRGARHGYFAAGEEQSVIAEIRQSGADVLLVALGAPRQDLWIRRYVSDLGVGAAIGVGGLFDFYSGRIPRAPQWLREMGLEWFYRLLQEPGRMWRRYVLGNAVFLYRVGRERCGLRLPRHLTPKHPGVIS